MAARSACPKISKHHSRLARRLLALAKDRPHQDIPKITAQLTAWLKKEDDTLITDDQNAFIPVRDFTSRHQCVTLSFHAASKALQQL